MKKIILVLAVVFAINTVFTSCKEENKVDKKEQITSDKKEVVYQCPMKCEKEKTYHKEGTCPVCEMKLKQKKK